MGAWPPQAHARTRRRNIASPCAVRESSPYAAIVRVCVRVNDARVCVYVVDAAGTLIIAIPETVRPNQLTNDACTITYCYELCTRPVWDKWQTQLDGDYICSLKRCQQDCAVGGVLLERSSVFCQ